MPSINGITACICTHEGPIEEFAADEFAGGVSCYIPAHSGQQFWLRYSIEQPIRAKSVSVEFHVDGQRIDTQFPLAAEGSDPPVVGPVQSSIFSQYGRDNSGNVYRRDVFFTLIDRKPRSSRNSSSLQLAAVDKAGTIECKVFRAEKTGEWNGVISPDNLASSRKTGSYGKRKGVSHTARLGAKIEATPTTRYTFRTLDPESSPFAWVKFYYRSAATIERVLARREYSLRPSSPSVPLHRMTSGKKLSLYQSIVRGKEFVAERLVSRSSHFDPISRSSTPALDNVEETLKHVESELAEADAGIEQTEQTGRIAGLYSKLERLRETSQTLRDKEKTLRKSKSTAETKAKSHQQSKENTETQTETQTESVARSESDVLGDNNNDGLQEKADGSHKNKYLVLSHGVSPKA